MGWLQRAWQWVKATETTLSLLDLALRVIGISTVLSTVVGAITWFAANPYAGLVVGLGAWITVAVLLLVLMSRRAQAPAPSGAEPSGTVQQLTSQQDQLRAEIREQERERQQLISRVEQREAEIERLQEQNERLVAERDVLRRERVEQATGLLGTRPRDELRRRYFRVSQELFRFADERDEKDPQKRPEETPGWWKRSQKGSDHDDETKVQYSKRFGGEVGALLDAAQQRKWIEPEERQRLEESVKATFTFATLTARIREIAQQLERFGHRL